MPKIFVMIQYEAALDICLSHARVFGTEKVAFDHSVNRVLAVDIYSDIDMPPFDKSAMDGYACRREDLDKDLKVIESVQAGIAPLKVIGRGECAQIMTGAIVPEGADLVIKVEDTETIDDDTIRFVGNKTPSNICYLGEDVRKGDLIISKGTLLGTRHIPNLASVGAVEVEVYKQARVAVVATGTELVEPSEKPGRSQIRNSNAWQMSAQLSEMGVKADYFGIAPDDEDLTCRIFEDALKDHDVLILSGGVSMGEFDFVPGILSKLGFELHFQQVAIQPGKPTTFASSLERFVFGLPGNPVSSYFLLELMVKPFLFACMSHEYKAPVIKARMAVPYERKKDRRLGWIPVRITNDHLVEPLEYHGSAHIFSLKDADGILPVPVGTFVIDKGEEVDVRPI